MNTIDVNSIKLYHIIHVDKLPLILGAGELICDRSVQQQQSGGTTIGMSRIKERRMNELVLGSYPDLYVGDCVPFYFCPRSIMLYMFYCNNHPDISYRGGQEPIVHLVFNMANVINWAEANERRWIFTDSNAGSYYFNDYSDIAELNRLNWYAINAKSWRNCKEEKQAEFLVEQSLPWNLVEEIAVYSVDYCQSVSAAIASAKHQPQVTIKRDWYY